MAKYNSYIELSPNYESVVDLNSEERNPNLWQEYIVHDDMKIAVDKICESLKYETKDARRSFWIHGAYGTGKSYAAIVLKHLFEDPLPKIQAFLSNKLLLPYRNKFLAIRKKGEYLVVWKSGCTDIKRGTQLMMEMEWEIRCKLRDKFGDKAYYGRKSLIAGVQNLLNDSSINWQNIFSAPEYGLSEDYASFDEFRNEAMDGGLKACDTAAKICREKGWALFATVDTFEEWIKDIIQGNGLQDTGIVFIWDEFTAFVRECGDDNVLQRLSEFCKQQPFFMFLIVHIETSWVVSLGEETYKRILHRYHELEFHISESAAYDLIGNSILTRAGMDDQWNDIKDQLMRSLSKEIATFDNLDINSRQDRLRQLFPLHPMTLLLLAIVAQNFGASQRTLFRFMKDQTQGDQHVGFIHYINSFGPDDWQWLTPDFLWDYFFTRESDIRDFSLEARRTYQHFVNKSEMVQADDMAMHVFKAAMLLVAVMSTEKISQLRSQSGSRRILATTRTLYKCFDGQLTDNDVDKYLEAFEQSGILRLDRQPNGDARIELPYTGNADVFDVRLDQTKKKFTRHELFKKGSVFSKAIEDKMWEKTNATFSRVHIVACSSETNSLNTRLEELRAELGKHTYKVGMLVVAISEPNQYAITQSKLREISENDKSKRLICCAVKEPLSDDRLDRWYRAITHKDLAGEEGKRGSANKYEEEAAIVVEEWATPAADGQITAYYGDTLYSGLYGKDDLMRRVEKDVIFKLFSAAPELVVSQNTAYRRSQESAITAAIERTATNSQISNIANGLKAAHVWDAATIDELELCDTTTGSQAIAALARFLHGKLAQGAKIKIDLLWLELQTPPFGYYDSLACAYLLGFVMRYYVNGEFNWITSDSNVFYLNEKNMATMIFNMCKDKAFNNTLSSGTAIWQQFRQYARKIFNLSEQESASEEQARKYMRERIIGAGTPFWVLKHVSEGKLGGVETKEIVCKVVDRLCDFIAQQGDQEAVMGDIITLFKGRGTVRQGITELFADKSERYLAFRSFILQNQSQLKDSIDAIGVSPDELFDAARNIMQGAIYTWTEQQVINKLLELSCEYQLIDTLNKAMDLRRKTTRQLYQDMDNCFEHMKIPGSVIENLNMPWVTALRIMRKLSTEGWTSLTTEQKQHDIEVLSVQGKTAWDYLKSSKLLLSTYMARQKIVCTEEEINNIYAGLEELPYNTAEVTFKTAIQSQMEKISYERNKMRLRDLWQQKSGEATIVEWCRKYATPIQWVVGGDALPYIQNVKAIQDNRRIDSSEMHNTVRFFEKNDFGILRDMASVKDCFFTQIGESHRDVFSENNDAILARIRMKLGADVFSWAYNTGAVRSVVEAFVRENMESQYRESAQKNVAKMSVADLRGRVLLLLKTHPEICKLFLDKEE